MARTPASKKTDWRSLVSYGSVRPAKPPRAKKSNTDKLLDAFDKQVASYQSGDFSSKSWFKPEGDRINLQLKHGASSLQLHPEGDDVKQRRVVNFAGKDFKTVAKGIRAAIAAGEFDDAMTDAENDRATRKAARAK